jgi:hypothetical protein
MMGFVLFIVARFLQWILTPIFLIYALFRAKNIDKYLFDIAFSIDQLGNVIGAPMMNDILLKKNPTKTYGNPDETISHVTGVNYMSNKLSIFGKILVMILNSIDKNHVQKAANNEQ